jgi:large subunit ribosomal protein L4e
MREMAEKAEKKKEKSKGTSKKAKKTPTKKKGAVPKDLGTVNLYSMDGKVKEKIQLPKVFFEDIRVDLIRKAVKASRANRRQPYGPNPGSGMRHAVATWGKGRGVARVQRLKQGRTAAESPNNVGGRRAHPPRPEKNWEQKLNRKEGRKARNSALSATKDPKLVMGRGHRLKSTITTPIVVVDDIEDIKTAKEAVSACEKLGVKDDLERAKNGIHIRAGRGKMRGRKYKKPKSLLLVVSDSTKTRMGFGNISGVDVTTPSHLNVELLAPGGDPGRLMMISQSAMKYMEKW